MQLHAVERLARSLMAEHGLSDWTFAFDRAVRRAGACHFSLRRGNKITLSAPLMSQWAESEVRNVILHEIAHALAGHRAGHGPLWKAHARRIGCTGDRCWTPSADAPAIPKRWVGQCPTCSHEWRRHRRSEGYCPPCSVRVGHTAASKIRWRENRESIAA